MVSVFSKFHDMNKTQFHKINTANAILLPKNGEATKIGDFRLISLIHSLAKLITKLLSIHLATHMDNLVSKTHKHMDFLYMQNVTRSFHRSKTSMLVLKLDIAKAFDSI